MPHALVAPTRTPSFALSSLICFSLCPTPAGFLSLLPPSYRGLSFLCAHPVGRPLPSPSAPSACLLLFRVTWFFCFFLEWSCCVFALLVLWLGFFLPSSLHARMTGQYWTYVAAAPVLSLFRSSRSRGLSLWRSPAMPGGRPSLVSPPLRSPPRPTLGRAPLALPPPYCSSLASCAPRCSSPRRGYISLAQTRRSTGARSASR